MLDSVQISVLVHVLSLHDIFRLSCMPLCVWIEEISKRYLLEINVTHYTLIPYYDLTRHHVIAD
jgi:hypothetical protein